MEPVSIRSVQHFLYCPHRWGLMEIDRAWAENYFVAKANLLHERVHTADAYASRGKRVYTSVSVWNDNYGLYGVTDCLEEREGQYTIVEYKPTAPKSGSVRPEDAMQVFAQKLCVDQVFSTDCGAVVYYADTKKRVALPLKEQYSQYAQTLRQTLQAMDEYRRRGEIPPIRARQICSGCSMKDLCLPSASKKHKALRDVIGQFSEDEL